MRRPDLGRDLAGLQQLRRQQPLRLHRRVPARRPVRLQGRLHGLLQPPVRQPRTTTAARALFSGAEYPMVRFLEAQRLQRQLHQRRGRRRSRGSLLLNHKIFISSGHDEYWSATQRAAIEAARDAGVNLAFFSGNEVLLEDALGAERRRDQHPNRTLVVLQGHALHARSRTRSTWTGTWGPALRAAVGRRDAAERADRPVVPGQLRHVRHHGPGRLRQAALVAQHRGRRRSRPASTLTLGAGHARLRVGRRRRQRLPARRPVRPVLDDRQRPRGVHRLRQHDDRTAPRPTT